MVSVVAVRQCGEKSVPSKEITVRIDMPGILTIMIAFVVAAIDLNFIEKILVLALFEPRKVIAGK